MKDIKKLRTEIDKIDTGILVLLKKRFDVAKQISKYKKKNGLKIVDKKREKEVLLRIREKSKKLGINPGFTWPTFEKIIKQSRKIQK
jgi:chorismate mutase